MNCHAQGKTNYHNGLAAEDCVERVYCERDAALLARRWRGTAGEIDLVFRQRGTLIFVEVKLAATCASAATRLSARQLDRVMQTAEEFALTQGSHRDLDLRIDLAAVNKHGRVEIHENISV
ncbi:MAG: YraN family protein [Boseongicola sp.]|nr:YraN family protein [Boseongicola sp.]MDD9976409.1 YraN family protein [Boseongicola sp.]